MSNKIILTDEQGIKIIEEWNRRPKNPPSIAELGKMVFGEDFNPRSEQGIAIKEYIYSRVKDNNKPKQAPKIVFELNEEQKQFIINSGKNMKPTEIAKILFENPTISPKSTEVRAIVDFMRSMPANIFENEEVKGLVGEDFVPPKTIVDCVKLINKYDHVGIEYGKISARQKKETTSLINYMNSFRFKSQTNYYDKEKERELFLSSFIRYTFDKPDLVAEEVDQYIILCEQIVAAKAIEAHVKMLEELLHNSANEGDTPQIRMGLVEAISTARSESNDCIVRQSKLYESLIVKRSKRIENAVKENASILNLVQMWKQKETRDEIIKIAEKGKQLLSDEFDRISNLDQLKIKLLGMSKEEALN